MKLKCKIDLSNVDPSCGSCHRCTSASKGTYQFDSDLSKSQELVDALVELVEEHTSFHCSPPEHHKAPDIRVYNGQNRLVCRIEAKMLEDKPFMKVHEKLSGHDLQPKETMVVDEPKLKEYFRRSKDDNQGDAPYVPTFVVWHLGRPCEDVGGITVFQECGILKRIFDQKGDGRAFERKTGAGDYRDGQKQGITKKYHYSTRECRPIEELAEELQMLE